MEKNDYFTLSFLGEENKSIHKICGSKSGREVDKIKETGLKPMITDKGNVLFEQGRLSLECRKLYTDVLRKENFLDPSVYEQWYTTHGGLHHVYVAEITSAWIKDNLNSLIYEKQLSDMFLIVCFGNSECLGNSNNRP